MANVLEEKLKQKQVFCEHLIRNVYNRRIGKAQELYKHFNRGKREMSDDRKRQLAMNLHITEELLKKKRTMEKTYFDDALFAQIALDVVTAANISSIIPEIATVEPMERRRAEVYYMNLVSETTKGSITAGDTIISAKTGYRGQKLSGQRVEGETIFTGDGSTRTFTGTLVGKPLADGSTVKVRTSTSTVLIGTVDPASATITLTGTNVSGTITKSTGAFSITFTTAPWPDGIKYYVDYSVVIDRNSSLQGKVKFQLTSEMMYAEKYLLETEYILDALYDYEKVRGEDSRSEIIALMTSQIVGEQDQTVIDMIFDGATETSRDPYPLTPPTNIQWFFHKEYLKEYFGNISSDILAATRRAVGNIIICGTDALSRIQTVTGFESYTSESDIPSGPFVAGVLGNQFKIVCSPNVDPKAWCMGFKGQSYLQSGFLVGDYMPLFTTPTLIHADTTAEVGLAYLRGFKMINPYMYIKGVFGA